MSGVNCVITSMYDLASYLRRRPNGRCSFLHKADRLAGAVGRANAAFNADIGIDMALDLTL